ncbi:hypothetical protein ABKN59_003538 [Abortiporus biennis]
MNSIFNLKRKSRPRNKQVITSPSKAKPLDILPELREEDEGRSSPSSSSYASTYSPSRSLGGSATLGSRPTSDVIDIKRNSRRVVLTGVEGLTFDDFFPIGSRPPASPTTPTSQSPADDSHINFSGLGINLEFPSPPRQSSDNIPPKREVSPSPSECSSRTSSSSTSSSSYHLPSTPPTSDDESFPKSRLARAPTCKSQRASIMFMKSMPDLRITVPDHGYDDEDWSDGEDLYSFAQDLSDIVTLTSYPPSFPSTPITPLSSCDPHARPDSIPPPPRSAATGRSRHSKPLPAVPRLSIQTSPTHGPSVQLDPTFHTSRRRRSIPTRPPPPPPIRIECPSPTMEEKTDELLALLANAALGSGFVGTGLRPNVEEPASTPVTPSSIFAISTPTCLRPPPRMSIPADIGDVFGGSVSVADDNLLYIPTRDCDGVPATPSSISVYSQASMDEQVAATFDFHLASSTDTTFSSKNTFPAMPDSPLVGMSNSNMSSSSSSNPNVSDEPERILRSRWSSSTLASMRDQTSDTPQSASSWKIRFHIGSISPTKKTSKHSRFGSSAKPDPPSPSKVPLSPRARKSIDSDYGLARRDSNSSRVSLDSVTSDSGDSTASSGLRRKPIPIEIFMRC